MKKILSVVLLLFLSVNAEKKNEKLISDFYDAAVYGEMDKVKAMLKKNPSLVNVKGKWGFAALHGVAGEDQLEMLKFLISKGAKVDIQNDEGISPLHLAALPKAVQILVNNKAKINILDIRGNTPLHTHAAHFEGYDCMKALLELGAKPNLKNKQGETPSDFATSRKEISKVILLQQYIKK